MSYLVLARKARPKSFDQVIGQKAVVRTLQNALLQDRVAHAMIFSGVRGVGKTTLARIMAKALNCQERQGADPCNKCRSCLEISAGSSVDLVEIDGASNRGIQEIRELKENIRFMPATSRFKIIIIDEVHMLTTEAFNALLKTLEEPPEHVYFMFATTELHRVPVTILSRCQRYELKRIDSRELTSHFNAIAAAEKVDMEPAALALIVREAAGSVRDGLSLLDQVFSYCGTRVTAEDVTDMLGLVSHRYIADISDALLGGNLSEALGRLEQTYDYGMDSKRFINDLLSWFRTLVVCSISSDNQLLADQPDELLAAARECAGKYPARTIMLQFHILLEQLEKAGYSSRPRFAIEMAFIKAAQAHDVVPVTTLLGRLDQLLAGEDREQLSPGIKRDAVRKASDPAAGTHAPSMPDPQAAGRSEELAKKKTEPENRAGQTGPRAVPPSRGEAAAGNEPVSPEARVPRKTQVTRNVRQHWNEFIEYVRDRKPWMASALQVAGGVHLKGDELVIEYADPAECRLLKNRENITPLTEFALDFFQENFRIRFTLPDSNECAIDAVNGISPLQERQALANDSLVLTAVDIFNGEVGDIRVGPRFRKPINDNDTTNGSAPRESK